MNIVERRKRLQYEAMQNFGENDAAAASLADENTDNIESDEADIFERKKKFDELL